jgi:hydroxymethyl cephem carbamoyltransferase
MKILSLKPGHDGHVAYLKDESLVFSIEAEKDSWPRYASISPSLHLRSMGYVDEIPDVVAISGWVKGFHSISPGVEGGYFGHGENTVVDRAEKVFGKDVRFFSSSHERSHVMCAYGMSPFAQGKPCYALTWEGNIGAFYYVDRDVSITKIGDVMEDPGNKYAFLYALADPAFPLVTGQFRFEDAGKLMALVSYGEPGPTSADEQAIIDFILAQKSILLTVNKRDLTHSPFFNIGVETQAFKNLARKFSDQLFGRFHAFAREHLRDGLPLLISGGCGLNCDWNTLWRECGLFEDVFIPPCTNDSGSAIGTAIDAQRHYTGNAKIDWTVYAGEEFVMDGALPDAVRAEPLDMKRLASFLGQGNVVAWVQGRYEIGPRALGNRSLLAAPFTREIHTRLNDIKQREGFRPIAPICMLEEVSRHFDSDKPSQFMLHFQKLKTDALPAITHVDGSARLQSVTAEQNPMMYTLLSEFRQQTGYGVLCNTSLNFKGTGFINRMSDLAQYAIDQKLDGFVVNHQFYDCREAVANTHRTNTV